MRARSFVSPLAAFAAFAFGMAGAATAGCATYQDDLQRGQQAFEQNQHERALALFRALEADAPRLSASDRAHYAYLRGMTDYRIGYRSEARHWLSIAHAMDGETPGSLPPDWAKRSSEALQELNEEVYGGGVQALTNKKGGDAREPTQPPVKTKKPNADDEP